MGFLDNSGDIILDAVLTDLGRKRLAEGNFNIVKYGLGDDEINYQLYDKNHPSGTPFFDLEILQTPVLETFTNNTSTMKSTLLSLSGDHLYLPVIKLSANNPRYAVHTQEGVHLVAVNEETEGTGNFNVGSRLESSIGGEGTIPGVLMGHSIDGSQSGARIVIEQGIDNVSFTDSIGDLIENRFIVQMDGNLGDIVANRTGEVVPFSSEDDDKMRLYEFPPKLAQPSPQSSVIAGSQGRSIRFTIKAAQHLKDSNALFDRIGFKKPIRSFKAGDVECRCIDTIVRVYGVKMGSSVDIPIRFVKKI